jgi:hypothetical protein
MFQPLPSSTSKVPKSRSAMASGDTMISLAPVPLVKEKSTKTRRKSVSSSKKDTMENPPKARSRRKSLTFNVKYDQRGNNGAAMGLSSEEGVMSDNSLPPLFTSEDGNAAKKLVKMASIEFKDEKVRIELANDSKSRPGSQSGQVTPNAAAIKLIRKLSSFTLNKTAIDLADVENEETISDNVPNIVTQQKSKAQKLLGISDDEVVLSNESRTRQLLRKLSSFSSMKESQELETFSPQPTKNFRSSVLSSLRLGKFLGNPTKSFSEEDNNVSGTEEKPTVKAALVKYFQRNTVIKDTRTTELEDPEESTIRQIIKEQEEEEEKETIRRLVLENNNENLKAAARWRKAQMMSSVVARLSSPLKKVNVDDDTTSSYRSTAYINSLSDCGDDHDEIDSFDDEYEQREFGTAFFD